MGFSSVVLLQDSELDSLLGTSSSSRPGDVSTMSEESISADLTNLGPGG